MKCSLMLSACLCLLTALADCVHAGGKGTAVTLGALKSTTPGDWKSQAPSNKFRAYQFAVGDAELVIFFFGENGGGSAEDNIQRWKGTFLPPEGKSIEDASKVE